MNVFRSIFLLPVLFFYVGLCSIFFAFIFILNQTIKFFKK